MREADLLLEASERHVADATETFFEELWREAEQRQRRSARRWRAAALALAVLAAAAVSAAGVMASSRAVSGPLDRTWRCTPASGPFSGKPTLGIHGSPKTARIDPFFVLSSRQPPQDAGSHFGTAALQFDAASTTVNWDKQLCKPVHEQPVFGSRGLVQNNVYTSTFLGSFSGDCATPPAVLIRAHITFAHAGASAARVVVVSAAKQKPLAYFTWTPHRIAVWVARACDVRAYPY